MAGLDRRNIFLHLGGLADRDLGWSCDLFSDAHFGSC